MYYGWRIAAACFTILFVIVGIVYYSFPVFYAPLIEEFQWSRAAATAGYAISIVFVGPLFGISAGFLIDRYGTRRILLGGLLFSGVAFLGFGFMQSLWMFYLFYFMQTIGYVSAGPVPNQVLISHWFARMRGRVMGLAYVGIGLGGAVAPVLAQFLIKNFGWRRAMMAISGTILFILVPVTVALVKNRPEELGLRPDGDSNDAAPAIADAGDDQAQTSLAQALETRAFWMIVASSLLSIGAIGAVIQHLQLYLRDQRFSAEEAAEVASFLLITSILGRLVMGYLADRLSKKYVMLAAYLMVACGIPLLNYTNVPGVAYLFAFVFGFGMGAAYFLIPLVTAECFGLASLGKLMAVILTTYALGQAFAPVVVGWIYDVNGSYDLGFVLVAVMAVLGAAAVPLIPLRNQAAQAGDARVQR